MSKDRKVTLELTSEELDLVLAALEGKLDGVSLPSVVQAGLEQSGSMLLTRDEIESVRESVDDAVESAAHALAPLRHELERRRFLASRREVA